MIEIKLTSAATCAPLQNVSKVSLSENQDLLYIYNLVFYNLSITMYTW